MFIFKVLIPQRVNVAVAFVLTAFQTISLQKVVTDLLSTTVTRLQGVQFPSLTVGAACSNIQLTWLSNEFLLVPQSTQFSFLDGTSLQVEFSISTLSAYRVNTHTCTLGVGTTCSTCVPVHTIVFYVEFVAVVSPHIEYLVLYKCRIALIQARPFRAHFT